MQHVWGPPLSRHAAGAKHLLKNKWNKWNNHFFKMKGDVARDGLNHEKGHQQWGCRLIHHHTSIPT